MTDFERFLAEALPPLGLSPSACRRRNLRRRVTKRMESLGIHDFPGYLRLLRGNPAERELLRSLLTVTISRFFRNRRVFEDLSRLVLPLLAAKGAPARAWSAGCASGEEPYTLRILWEELADPKSFLSILATDIDDACLARASAGIYAESSLREVPGGIARAYFRKEGSAFRLREDVVRKVRFERHDLLRDPAPGEADIILCRNAAFTYFDAAHRADIALMFARALPPGGFLVIGRTEKIPPEAASAFETATPSRCIYRRLAASGTQRNLPLRFPGASMRNERYMD